MRRIHLPTLAFACAAAVALAAPDVSLADEAAGEDVFSGLKTVEAQDMATHRGGESATIVIQGNETNQSGSNVDSPLTNNGFLSTGRISPNNLQNNRGSFAIQQNTGNLVNMNHSNSINIYLQ